MMRSMSYEYDVSKLWLGGNYCNHYLFSRTDARSNLAGLWLADDDQFYVGRFITHFIADNERLPAQSTTFSPASQTTLYSTENLHVHKTFFVPYGPDDPRCAYTIVRLKNFRDTPQTVTIECAIQYPQFAWAEFVKLPDMTQKNKLVHSEVLQPHNLVLTTTLGRESEVRLLGTDGSAVSLTSSVFDSRSARLIYTLTLDPLGEIEVPFTFVLSGHGREDALARYAAASEYKAVLERTLTALASMLDVADILTPDPSITRAIKWAKVNILREERMFPIGHGFTNDPPQDVLVVRDVAWFTLGADYLTPIFSRGVLNLVRDYGVEDTGQLTEYFMACENPPYKSNYGMNINDDTPLYVFAAHHHYALTKDQEFLQGIYPTVRGAAEWILQQKHGGLIWCTSEESNVWGIASWRNIIPEYQLNGAVTEINAECYMALRLAGRLAEALGETTDAERFLQEALDLKEAMNTQLISEEHGLYLLNIDYQGVRHHKITGDLVFPVMFGIADKELSAKILALLQGERFWTEYGVRTVPPGEPEYDPEFGVRLMGGIWPNLTAWVAYAGRHDQPEKLIEGMRNIFRISEVSEPKMFKNVVPGQFPECLHGENFQSRGMALSPWMPPTYLWLAIDGLLGFRPSIGQLRVQPHLPEDWQWLAIRNVPYAGQKFSLFYYRGVIYSSMAVDSGHALEIYDEDVSDQVESNAYIIALKRATEVLVFVGVAERQGVTIRLAPPLISDEQQADFVLNPGEAQLLTFSTIAAPPGSLDDDLSLEVVVSENMNAEISLPTGEAFIEPDVEATLESAGIEGSKEPLKDPAKRSSAELAESASHNGVKRSRSERKQNREKVAAPDHDHRRHT